MSEHHFQALAAQVQNRTISRADRKVYQAEVRRRTAHWPRKTLGEVLR